MNKTPKCLAVLGTGSDVGKSIVTTALCRILVNHGIGVAPFKAQNMSNNSGVTPEGLEMGRAQIVQAEAARLVPNVNMNPVLLKPTSDIGAQVVLNGKVWQDASPKSYYRKKEMLFEQCCSAFDRLQREYETVVIEGAGSCAEVNLMENDIVNLRMAAYAEAPVLLVADIDRGGVFAQIVGTLACLTEEAQARIKGFIINRFRGDIDLFKKGVDWIEQKTGKPVFGVLPWFDRFHIEAEDAVVIAKPKLFTPSCGGSPAVGIIKLPHISNFNDFDPLNDVDGLELAYLEACQPLDGFKAVILPGTKSTCSDLQWLHRTGWTRALQKFADDGGHLLGICGGYQMMGHRVQDPDGLEGREKFVQGLALLPVETVLKAPKTTTLTAFSWKGICGQGYEIHMGQTHLNESRPLLSVKSRNRVTCDDHDGCISADGRILGTYMHGLFDTPEITRRWLEHIGLGSLKLSRLHGPAARDQAYDLLAEHAAGHIDLKAIFKLIGASYSSKGGAS